MSAPKSLGSPSLRPFAGATDMPSGVSPSRSASIAPALFTTEQAAAYLGMSEAKFHELRGEPWAPAPIPLGPRLVRWARTDLDAAIAAMPRQAGKASEPAQLARRRIESMKSTGVPA